MSSENELLKKEIERLKRELEKVLQEKEKIEKEFEEFKAKHAGTVEELKKALHLKPDQRAKKKKLGAHKGHPGYTRHIPERIDHIIPLNPVSCPICGEKFLGKTQEIRERYVTDIKFASDLENIKYEIHRKYCRKCKKIVEPEISNVIPYARFGLNLMFLVIYLRLGLRLPVNKIREYFQTMHEINISKGEIILISHQIAKIFGPYYKILEHLLKIARVRHSDTTGWRINGKNYTAWTFISACNVLYKITRKGNTKVPLKLFGKKQQGKILVVDRHSIFRSLAEKAGYILQLCWSHILDDSKGLARDFGREGRYVHRKLKQIFEDAKSLNHQGTDAQVQKLKKRIQKLSQRHYKHKTIWKFTKNLAQRDIENLFRFITDPDVDPTNNISERELRELVIIRKISNGSRSEKGSETTAILLSIIQTLRLKKKNILVGFQEILQNPSEA